jgi:o-succinylbenzoate---CoA ligase
VEGAVIDFESDESHLLLNPRMPADERKQLEGLFAAASHLRGHVWLATSGTTGGMKLTALSKTALLASARAVNRHLEAGSSDVWCCVLPEFHVGGLGIVARAMLAGNRVVRMEWDAAEFAEARGITLSALVPAQVSDLVRAGLRAPGGLRAIVVGGGALGEPLYRAARELGWPLLPSYGLTECASQVATARLGSPELIVLDHLEVKVDDGRLTVRGASLLTGYATAQGFVDPKIEGWFVTEDFGRVEGRTLQVEGRRGDFVKIGGESVDLARLDAILASIAGAHAAVLAVPDERLGHVVHLAGDAESDLDSIRAEYDARVHPFERARAVHRVSRIPRTALGKLMRGKLATMIPNLLE